MPIYEYECEIHGIIERWVKFGEEEPSRCSIYKNWEGPSCGEPLKRVLSASNFYTRKGFND